MRTGDNAAHRPLSGDVLAGAVTAVAAWVHLSRGAGDPIEDDSREVSGEKNCSWLRLQGFKAACMAVKAASAAAFKIHGRCVATRERPILNRLSDL